MSYQPDPGPNDAYAVIPTPAELRGPPTDSWTVTRYGKPVWHFPPDKRDLAERFATDRVRHCKTNTTSGGGMSNKFSGAGDLPML